MTDLKPKNFNNIHHMILVWRKEFLGMTFAQFMICLAAIGIVSNGLVLVLRSLALVGIIELQ